jgi:uncharacterized membrane protein
MSARLFIVASAVAFLGPSAASFADFRVCNQSREQIEVAFGYEGTRDAWVSEGWWTLRHGSCVTVWSGRLRNRYYYLYAEGDKGTEWDGSEGNAGYFCVKDEKFKLDHRKYGSGEEEDCKKHGLQSRTFFEIDVSNYGDWTHTLDPAQDAAAPPPRSNPPQQAAPAPKPNESARPGTTACERYPNLC